VAAGARRHCARGGFGLPTLPVADQIEEGFRRRLSDLPPPTRRFLTVAAADPTGDAALVWRAVGHLDLSADDAAAAIDAGLARMLGMAHQPARAGPVRAGPKY
jgi:hypothetical protein